MNIGLCACALINLISTIYKYLEGTRIFYFAWISVAANTILFHQHVQWLQNKFYKLNNNKKTHTKAFR